MAPEVARPRTGEDARPAGLRSPGPLTRAIGADFEVNQGTPCAWCKTRHLARGMLALRIPRHGRTPLRFCSWVCLGTFGEQMKKAAGGRGA